MFVCVQYRASIFWTCLPILLITAHLSPYCDKHLSTLLYDVDCTWLKGTASENNLNFLLKICQNFVISLNQFGEKHERPWAHRCSTVVFTSGSSFYLRFVKNIVISYKNMHSVEAWFTSRFWEISENPEWPLHDRPLHWRSKWVLVGRILRLAIKVMERALTVVRFFFANFSKNEGEGFVQICN